MQRQNENLKWSLCDELHKKNNYVCECEKIGKFILKWIIMLVEIALDVAYFFVVISEQNSHHLSLKMRKKDSWIVLFIARFLELSRGGYSSPPIKLSTEIVGNERFLEVVPLLFQSEERKSLLPIIAFRPILKMCRSFSRV